MIVPRSSTLIASDGEFTLYGVTTFKKYSAEFVHKCREHKWTPREYKYVEGGDEEERKEFDRVGADAKRLWGEIVRLGRTGWSEAVMVWVHVLVLRIFVETVLRYGLPLDFVSTSIKVRPTVVLQYLKDTDGTRQLGNTLNGSKTSSTIPTRTSPVMHSRAIRRAGCARTIQMICSTWQAKEQEQNIRRLCILSLKSSDGLLALVFNCMLYFGNCTVYITNWSSWLPLGRIP